MSIVIPMNGKNYTVAATPTLDSRNNWIVPTYTINSVAYNLPQDTKQAVPVYQSCALAEESVRQDALRIIATIQ